MTKRNVHLLRAMGCAVAFVACGDDESAGTGGGGGSTSSATSTSTASSTSTSTSTASASSTSSAGGEGGGSGGGDEGSGGAAAFECLPTPSDGAAITVVTVDDEGTAVPVDRVTWQDQPADAFWLEPEEAICAGGAEPPCSMWEIADHPGDRIAITSERYPDGETTEACFPYASAFVEVHPAGSRQLVHLTLPSDGTYCIDPDTGRSIVNVEHDEQVDDADCLAPPPDVAGPIVVDVTDLEGAPAPATHVQWYYHPESAEFDGEHQLACADQRCTRWVVTDSPLAGPLYFEAFYAGPLNPFSQQGWSGYEATSIEVELDELGAIVPATVTIQLDTMLEGAIGG